MQIDCGTKREANDMQGTWMGLISEQKFLEEITVTTFEEEEEEGQFFLF